MNLVYNFFVFVSSHISEKHGWLNLFWTFCPHNRLISDYMQFKTTGNSCFRGSQGQWLQWKLGRLKISEKCSFELLWSNLFLSFPEKHYQTTKINQRLKKSYNFVWINAIHVVSFCDCFTLIASTIFNFTKKYWQVPFLGT